MITRKKSKIICSVNVFARVNFKTIALGHSEIYVESGICTWTTNWSRERTCKLSDELLKIM